MTDAVKLVVVGMSHRSAPLSALERVAVATHDRSDVLAALLRCPAITEAMLVSTCNRVEVYAAVREGRNAASQVMEVLARRAGASITHCTSESFVHHGEAAAVHVFEVAAGLDSLVLGDEQILGQVRAAYAFSVECGAAGPVLHALAQQALRAGKQVARETGLASVGASVMASALNRAAAAMPGTGLSGRRAVVLGAGAMGALAVAHLQRLSVSDVVLVNRTPSRASQLAAATGSAAVRAVPATDVVTAISDADVVLACTTSPGAVVTVAQVRAATAGRTSGRLLVVCDLGMPRNVNPAVGELPGVLLLNLESLRDQSGAMTARNDVAAAHRIVTARVASWAGRRRASEQRVGGEAANSRPR